MTNEARIERIIGVLHTIADELQGSIFEMNELLGETAAEADIAEWKRNKFTVLKGGRQNDQL